ncbi:PRC-barrel domain-containing protein [Nucisporomicrobium flavum]|uniref:PRC-barrel domain-containing protein n=1 Tax=Nucisporomicrobium flavum TaxID=2785915 RepID=UPI0018F4B87F|nr:PRC-barrel domain-containing protein [Nucisporomicrobium flavum]
MTNHAPQLLKLSDTDLIIANPSEDIRGRTARDVNGEKIGKIEDLLIDTDDNQVRMLRVEHGGILGFGATPSFVPVEAISRITDDDVHLRQAGAKVAEGPRYDPELTGETEFYGQVYGYYGYPPFGTPGAASTMPYPMVATRGMGMY